MRSKLMIPVTLGAMLALGTTAASAAAAPSPPLPGGTYEGKSAAGKGKRIVVEVRAKNNSGQLRGVVRYPCAGVKARFRTDDGTFSARKRKGGRTVFKATGSFKSMNRAVGSIGRLDRSLRHGACRGSGFEATLRNAPRVREATVSYGPFPTEPTSGHGDGGGGHNVSRSNLDKPCEDCSIVGMVPELREADGRLGNFDTGSMLHHAVFFNQSEDDATCSGWSERFFAAGNERSSFLLPRGYGYGVSASDDWRLITHLMNLGKHTKDLFIEVTFFYVERTSELEGVKPFWLDINNCANSQYKTPAGRHTEAREFVVSPDLEGKVVAIGGHLHDHGERIKLDNLTSGEEVCGAGAGYSSEPSYQGHIESVGGCMGRPVAEFKAGDRLRLRSRYNAPEAIHDVMGIMVGYLAPSG